MPIYHVVLTKFKQDIAPADAEKVRKSLHALPSKIPAISSVKAGTKLKHPNDRDFDEGIIFVFEDEKALREDYRPHKAHRDHQELATPFTEDLMIFDIYCEE